jgi:transglutaminase-like putative cysteine protease
MVDAMKYRIRHRSAYSYTGAVDLSYHLLRLTPRKLPHQLVLQTSVTPDPAPATASTGIDYFGNELTFLTMAEPHDHFTVEMEATVDVSFPQPPDPAATPDWETVRDALRTPADAALTEACEFIYDSPLATPTVEIAAYAAQSFPAGRTLLEAVLDLTGRIHRDFTFDSGATVVATPLSEVMERRRGVCQDFAHLEIAALRAMGLAARYVSGYIRTYRDADSADLIGSDASHAWVSVFCPDFGWIDVDPTNNLVVGDEHIVLAWGRDYGDISPVRGVMLGGGEHYLHVAVDVAPD